MPVSTQCTVSGSGFSTGENGSLLSPPPPLSLLAYPTRTAAQPQGSVWTDGVLMSNPPLIPENAAAAAAAVSPARTAAGDPAAAAAIPLPGPGTGEARSETGVEAVPLPSPAAAAPTEQEEGPALSVPPPPPSPLPPPQTPPAHQDTAGSDPLAPQATEISAASPADPVKYARGPAVLQRPHGPSLLTQALATARGIPRQTQPDPAHSRVHASRPPLHSPDPQDSLARDGGGGDPRNGSLTQADGDSAAPRFSPRKTAMSASTATSTAMVTPFQGKLDLGEVNSMLNGHREFLSKAKRRTGSFEATERDRPNRWNTYTNPLASPCATDSPVAPKDAAADERGVADARPQPRAWKTDHRVSMGPEKAWSIGTSDSTNPQDGQVEKSISEVLAGVEHNTRSRKASHSLRFFKEGLPEEKGKRKDQRSAQPQREKSPSGGERLAEIREQPVGTEVAEPQASEDSTTPTERQDLARAPVTRTTEGKPPQRPSEDYFALKREAPAEQEVSEPQQDNQLQQGAKPSEPDHEPKPRRVSDLSVGESAEEGEESGEEKISSAVFLPHQALEQEQDRSSVPGVPPRVAPSRRHSRNDDFHPWLVKADEPEADRKRESIDLESEVGPEPAEYSSVAPEVASRQVDEPEPLDAREVAAVSARLSRPVSQYHEDAVHDHQLTPKQPLEAIELIPYKHQVGGHTTLWRFSRRAVCKQLNNRENEFYEKIERYHPELLAFLPRYIGVLNVTFQKQPRRKSTMKRDDAAVAERSQAAVNEATPSKANGVGAGEAALHASNSGTADAPRVISQSIQSSATQIPTVTFVDNQHILPRNLLQPTASLPSLAGRFRSASAYTQPGPETITPTTYITSSTSPSSQQHHDGRPSSSASSASASTSTSTITTGSNPTRAEDKPPSWTTARPTLQDRHANSWGATTVNKKLRNEVFNDAFLKQPIAIHRHRRGVVHHQRERVLRTTLQQGLLRSSGSDPGLGGGMQALGVGETGEKKGVGARGGGEEGEVQQQQRGEVLHGGLRAHGHSRSDLGQDSRREYCSDEGKGEGEKEGGEAKVEDDEETAPPQDLTGTSAPEPEILADSSPAQTKKKRRYSGSGLRRKPKDVRDGRGDLRYFEEADDAGYKGDGEDATTTTPTEVFKASPEQVRAPIHELGLRAGEEEDDHHHHQAVVASAPPVGPLPFSKIPRPINPKEAQTQRDSRVEYFLLLEDLTAGMKRPCIMDLKMGTRQYGVDANPKKQKSQQGKCAKTTSRELGVRVCGLQVWDVARQRYEFRDKYYGRGLRKGDEFQAALTRFLYDGVDRASILRHVPAVLDKLDQLEVIIERLRGYRFYAASLLMFYDAAAAEDDGDEKSNGNGNGNGNDATNGGGGDYYVEDSTTDFATDTEEAAAAAIKDRRARSRRARRREIDFKMADFANCVTAGDLSARDRPCPPRHPDEPDRGFLRGLRSLRRYFLKIQRDTRVEMGLASPFRNGNVGEDVEVEEDEGSVSE